MAMNSEQFDSLVFKLEEKARQDPKSYQIKVLLLALLGNAYIGFIELLLIAVLTILAASIVYLKWFALKGIILIGPFTWMVIKASWVTIEPPDGFEVESTDAPELFALIADLRQRSGAPRFHHVLIVDDLNAAVVQSPRLGMFGWYRNYLLIGLPLLKALTVEQLTAVLAHEFGHLAGGHGRASNWIYRQRVRWSRLLEELSYKNNHGSFLFKPFLNWFSPYFNAYSFPLARANEYEADATSVRLTSPRVAAEALTSVNVIGSYLSERFWPQIHKLADEQPKPNFSPSLSFGQRISTELDDESKQRWVSQALSSKTTSADTHPSLSDRLGAIGEQPHFAPPVAGAGADKLLGSALQRATQYYDENWQGKVSMAWRQRHQETQDARKKLAELNEKDASGSELTLQEAYDRASLTEYAEGNADLALEQFRSLHQRIPENAFVCLSLGARLLSRDDESGLELINRAFELDEGAIVKGLEILRDYYWRKGQEEKANDLHQKMIERANAESSAEYERDSISLNNTFDEHGLDSDSLEALREQLKNVEGVSKAYLVKKRVYHFPHKPLYVLGFTVQRGYGLRPKYTREEVMYRLQNNVQYPWAALITNVGFLNRKMGRKIRRVNKSRLL